MEQIAIKRDVWIEAPREKVWNILTDPVHIEQWWGEKWAFSARSVGGAVTFGEPDDASHATIAVFDAPSRFVLQWQAGADWPAMTTEFTLAEESGGTRVHVRESGFEQFDEDVRQKRLEQNENGYRTVMQDLKTYVEAQK